MSSAPDPTVVTRRREHAPRWFAVKLIIGLALLFLVGVRVDLATVAASLKKVATGPLIVALGVYAVSIFLHAARWWILLAARRIPLGFAEALRLILAGNFLALFLPGNMGGDVYRVFSARHASASLLESAGIVLVERYCGFLATFAMAFGGLAWGDFASRQPRLTWLVLALFAIFLLPLAAAASPRLAVAVQQGLARLGRHRSADAVARAAAAARGIIGSRSLIAMVVALSVGMKFCVAWIIHLLATALGLRVGWVEVLVFLPIHTVVSALPVSLNGLGVREANLVGFFSLVGLGEEQAAALALLHLAWLYATALPGGFLLLGSGPTAPQAASLPRTVSAQWGHRAARKGRTVPSDPRAHRG